MVAITSCTRCSGVFIDRFLRVHFITLVIPAALELSESIPAASKSPSTGKGQPHHRLALPLVAALEGELACRAPRTPVLCAREGEGLTVARRLEACAFHFLAPHRHQRFEVLERSRRPFALALALRCFAPGGAPLAFGLFVFAPALALAPGAPGGAPARCGELDPMLGGAFDEGGAGGLKVTRREAKALAGPVPRHHHVRVRVGGVAMDHDEAPVPGREPFHPLVGQRVERLGLDRRVRR